MILRDKGNVSVLLDHLSHLDEIQSDKATINLFRHDTLGKVLAINGEIQHVEKWSTLYHESVVHLPFSFVKTPKTALILGGGSLYAAYEILKYSTIEKLTLVEHDPKVIALMCKYYSHAANILNDSRIEILYQDAVEFINNSDHEFDYILNDAFDILQLETGEIVMNKLYTLLSNHGVCSDLIYRHVFETWCLNSTFELLKSYPHKAFSLTIVPEYPGVLHILSIWGKSKSIRQNANKTINIDHKSECFLENQLCYFNPRYLPFYLYIPPYIRKLMQPI